MAREPILEAAAKKAASYHDGKDGFKNTDRKNLYQCERNPLHMIVTVDLEPGVTPFLVECRQCRRKGTKASMKSAMYVLHPMTVPTHEWFRPDSMAGYDQWTREHLENGGLILRKREVAREPIG